MSFAIPRLQYKNVDQNGDTTSGSGTISGLASVAGLAVGMFVRGAGVPAGATIGTIGVGSIVLASGVLATATATVPLSFGIEILFDYPPKEPTGNIRDTKSTITESLSGLRQVSVSSVNTIRKLVFSFISPAKYVELDTFFVSHAILGLPFRYFEDKTSPTYIEYDLDELKITPKKLLSRGTDLYVWEIPLTFRSIL